MPNKTVPTENNKETIIFPATNLVFPYFEDNKTASAPVSYSFEYTPLIAIPIATITNMNISRDSLI